MAKILIVEDDASALDTLRRALTSEGHEILTSSDGRDALSILSANFAVVELLITDVSMPDIDGITLVESALKQKVDLPVIVMSGLPGELERAESLGAPSLRVVSKPFSLDEIRKLVHATLES